MRIVAILLLAVHLFATMILNLNVKEQKNSVELLINFDVPYEGKIAQKRESDKIILFLKNVKILAHWSKKLNNPFIYQIDVVPAKSGTQIFIYTVEKIKIYASKSKDGFSLMLKFKRPGTSSSAQLSKGFFSNINFAKIGLWVGIGLFGVILIFIVLKLLNQNRTRKTKRIVVQNSDNEEFAIKFEKPLDAHNKIALISFKGINYLVIIGSTNVLLGKYKEGEIESHEDFEKAIASQNLTAAIQPKEEDDIFITIEEYKRKASGEI
ncbi:hypothetical protein NitYY0826_C0785 [Nitratiruptor sp. YY08-26]|uniref:hypothetical protein n=1 Tax=unclassified Nitratiruptor TaxID=2624044 RepID=UPI00191507FB|nr:MULTISPECIES: hypothetical protein [unclassified Nitratiruptor]BCD61918.1 hypothetical protein NitYY0813_C0783 [Nitratiruptor sp. YY08-13]BCD65853.1 hypothetical protein NitYY0826_C0785 [Nitratiruptor sp. YY08-26]